MCKHFGAKWPGTLFSYKFLLLKKKYSLEDRTTLIDNSKILGETIKQIFWQTLINDQKLKLKLQINEFVIEGLLNIGSNATIISPKSWQAFCSL